LKLKFVLIKKGRRAENTATFGITKLKLTFDLYVSLKKRNRKQIIIFRLKK